jgi:riboflavin-specific deaminase-like protein
LTPNELRAAAHEAVWPTLWAEALRLVEERRAARPVRPWIAPETLDETSADLHALYAPLVQRNAQAAPWVIAHLGQSLDGFIATRNGDSRYVTGALDLDHMHRLRALADAVIVGAGTVAIDDPLLTTRRVPGRHAVRVVLDPMQRVPTSARVLNDRDAPTLWLTDARWHKPVHGAGVAARALALPGLLDAQGQLDAGVAVRALVAQGLRVLFVEGGGVTVSRFLAQGLLDRLHLALAPVLIGEGRRGVHLPASGTMAECLRPRGRVVRLGDDQLWDFALVSRPSAGAPQRPRDEVEMADAQPRAGHGGAA